MFKLASKMNWNKPYLFGLFIFMVSFANLLHSNSSASEPAKIKTKHIIVISQFEFVPAKLEVKQGDMITWVNKDFAPHNITSIGNISVNKNLTKLSPDLLSENEYSMTISESFDYLCGLHPSMKGQIIVIKN